MEVEREKKEKLAAARKKLNEYKLSRSGGGGRSNNSSTTEPSQPADVPLFYQNINTPTATFNIFNPAAGNNNNVGSSPYFVPSSVVPEVDSTPVGLGYTSNQSDVKGPQPNANFFTAEQQFSTTASIFNQEESQLPLNPFISSSPVAYHAKESPVIDLSSENSPFAEEHEVQSALSLFSTVPEPDVSLNNQDIILNAVKDAEKIQTDNVLLFSPSNMEYVPSAPLVDLVESKTDQASLDESTCATVASSDLDDNNQELANGNHSVPSPKENFIADSGGSSIDDHGINSDPPIPMFASSLFNANGSETDAIFNFGISGNPQPSCLPPHETSEHPFMFTTVENSDIISGQSPIVNDEKGAAISSFDSYPEEITENNPVKFSDVPTLAMNVLLQEQLPTELPVFNVNSLMAEMEGGSSVIASNVQSPSASSEEPHMLFHKESPPEHTSHTVASASIASDEAMQQMRSVQEALELQIEELRRENTHLLGRQSELASRIEESEKLAHEFKLERDRVREEAATTSQALRSRINSLCEENQRIVKHSTDIGVDLRAKVEEKSKQLEEMQKAVIIVSQSKMEFAGRLDHELEQVKELQKIVQEKDDEIQILRVENNGLKEKLKQDQQKDAVIHQLHDQSRHYQVQCETLQKELFILRNRLKTQHETYQNKSSSQEGSDDPKPSLDGNSPASLSSHDHHHSEECKHHDHQTNEHHHHEHGGEHQHLEHGGEHQHLEQGGEHQHLEHGGEHQHLEQGGEHQHHEQGGEHHHHEHGGEHHHHEHGGEHHHHAHGGEHHHHDHNGDHHHHHDHAAEHELVGKVVARVGPSDEVTEMKKTLHRLQWENSSFRNELDVLAVDAKQKKTYEEKCAVLEEENEHLKKEVEQLEHVIIQLQGENDTIGDYITLYQTQKMALKECAKEKDVQLELLAREREMLLHRLSELTALVKDLRESKSEAGSQCADDHVHTLDVPIPTAPKDKRQIEGKIRDLLTEISSSSLIENFHPCAVCSGRLMTV